MVGKLAESLKLFLEKGKDWERKPTNVPSVFILKIPVYRGHPQRLCVEINPVDASGNPTKKRGLVIKNFREFKELGHLLAEEKLEKLVMGVDEVNPPAAENLKKKEEAKIIKID